jgi:hypothetical protein
VGSAIIKFIFSSLFASVLVLDAATSSPVNISSVVVSSGTATVSCGASNCNINANYGFCIAGVSDATLDICGTAVTGTGGTSFTFTTTASNESLGTAGTVSRAVEIVFLSSTVQGNQVSISYLLWLTTVTGVVDTTRTSLWSGASASQIKAIQAGTTIEVSRILVIPLTSFTKANAQSWAQNDFLANETSLENGIQPGQYFGQFCDPVGCSF